LKEVYTTKQALHKAAKFCAYQERTQQEVRNKLYEYGLNPDEVEEVICELITENFINEERFAQIYARSKFRQKKWGRIKIRQHLKQKGVSQYCIQKGLAEIEEEEYQETLLELLTKKNPQIKAKHFLEKKQKLSQYALSKGYELEAVLEQIKQLKF